MIELKKASYTFPYEHKVLREIDLNVSKGDFWGFLGENGSGKTTLMEILVGLKNPTSGSLHTVFDSPEEYIKNLVYISHDITIRGSNRVREFFDFNSFFYPKYQKAIEIELLEYFNLPDDVTVGSLSTGQQKKVQIIAALSSGADLIFVDEITAVLDPHTRRKFFHKLTEFNQELGRTIILATNIVEDLAGRVNKVLMIENGKLNPMKAEELEGIYGKI